MAQRDKLRAFYTKKQYEQRSLRQERPWRMRNWNTVVKVEQRAGGK